MQLIDLVNHRNTELDHRSALRIMGGAIGFNDKDGVEIHTIPGHTLPEGIWNPSTNLELSLILQDLALAANRPYYLHNLLSMSIYIDSEDAHAVPSEYAGDASLNMSRVIDMLLTRPVSPRTRTIAAMSVLIHPWSGIEFHSTT